MAKLIQAVAWLFGLGLVTRQVAQIAGVTAWPVGGPALTDSDGLSVLRSMWALTLGCHQVCSAVKLPGIGSLTSAVDSDGRMRVSLPEAPDLRHAFNTDGVFRRELATCAKTGTNGLPPPRRSSPP